MKKIALILAGGKGNRFWPKSSPDLPKQFLQIYGSNTQLQATVKRVKKLIQPADIFIITGTRYFSLVKEQAHGIPEENILLEPLGKDTAPAAIYSALWLEKRYKDAILITIPADHYVASEEEWVKSLQIAAEATALINCPVLIGTTPERPETGYGYIIPGERIEGFGDSLRRIEQFVEKPDSINVEILIKEKKAVWNSGMFIWPISIIRKLAEEHQPEMAKQIKAIIQEMTNTGIRPNQANIPSSIVKLFQGIKPISIDYGLIEHCRDLAVVAASFSWDDLGGWQAMERLYPVDSKGNVLVGNAMLTDSEDCIIDWRDGPALIVGLQDVVVVGHEGKLLACKKEYLPKLKDLLSEHIEDPYDLSLTLKTVSKPWGKEIWWAVTDKYAAKILEIKEGHSTSMHLHQQKLETFYIEKGKGSIVLADKTEELYPGKVLTILPGVVHRILAYTYLRIFEVSTTELDDVIRLEDLYGRSDYGDRELF